MTPAQFDTQSIIEACRATFQRFQGFVDLHFQHHEDGMLFPVFTVFISDMGYRSQYPLDYFGIPVCVELVCVHE